MKKLIDYIAGLMEEQFYGRLEIQFEKGKIVLLRKIENVKMD